MSTTTRTRSTLDLAALVAATNRMLADSDTSPEVRHGACMVIEQALKMANAYAGFTYTASEYAAPGEPTHPGSTLRLGSDEYRRRYHVRSAR